MRRVRGHRRRLLHLAILVTLALLSPASAARASYDPIASGNVKLRLDPSFEQLLRKNRIQLSGRQGARTDKTGAQLTVIGGKADPAIKKAEIDAGGELVFRSRFGAVVLKHISLFTKPTPLIAKVSGGQLKIARAGSVKLKRGGFGNVLTASRLRLTSKAAIRLNKRLHTTVFVDGLPLGNLNASTQLESLAILAENSGQIDVDPSFFAKLTADSTSLNPIFPAEHSGLSYRFPIIGGGRISPDGTSGTVRLGGNLEFLRLGSGQVFWKEPWFDLGASTISAEVDLEPTPAFPGSLGRAPVLGAGTSAPGSISSDPATRTLTLSGMTVRLDAAAAEQFDKAFGEASGRYQSGELVGTLSAVVQAQ
jgi:hypothetical protein